MKHNTQQPPPLQVKMAYETDDMYYEAAFINDNDGQQQANYIMDNYVYCGYHTENHSSSGRDKILHYISKATLGNRDIKTLSEWEYELEVWPSDRYYSYLII
jgi:hypothetical protein